MHEKKTMASQWLKQRQKEQGFLTDADFHAASVMEKEHLKWTYFVARKDESSSTLRYEYNRSTEQFFDHSFKNPFY